jgi:amino acid transporter
MLIIMPEKQTYIPCRLCSATANIRFNKALKKQGVPRSVLPFRAFQPYMAWAVVICFAPIVFFSGWTTLSPFVASDFFSSYVNIGFFIVLFIGWKVVKKTRWVRLDEMDVSTHYTEGSVVVSKFALDKK